MGRYSNRICNICGQEYEPTGAAQKSCKGCMTEAHKRRCAKRHKETYVRKGYNQKGENNNNWTGGIGTYRQEYNKLDKCEACGSTEHLVIHHIDENRYNNELNNLMTICRKCHQNYHLEKDPVTGRFVSKE